ncbi:MAG: peptidoglycan DD-metalloendopeptidase family protein [Rhodocyclaceae bacterium]
MTPKGSRILAQLRAARESAPARFWGAPAALALSLLSVVGAFATVAEREAPAIDQSAVLEAIALTPAVANDTAPAGFVREERIERGDTVARLFDRLGVDDAQALETLRTRPEAAAIFRQLRPGKAVSARTNAEGRLLRLEFPLNAGAAALVVERQGEALSLAERPLALESRALMASGEIRSSLFAATDAIGLPDSVTMQLADIFSGDIDFHRDLRRGDSFAVVYEMEYSAGSAVRPGRILAAEFVNQGRTYRAFRFRASDGREGYYGEGGRSIRKAFLRSPLEFSRITSGFALRFHPVLQKWRAHNGVDYGAPTGTPVRTTADGIVEFAGRQNGYGNVVIVRHAGRYSTLYAHLNGIAAGIRKGVRVRQADVIGYVGATGLATGPHLHYEFRIDGQHRNPLAVALPEAPPLAPRELASFAQQVEPLLSRLSLMRPGSLALLD